MKAVNWVLAVSTMALVSGALAHGDKHDDKKPRFDYSKAEDTAFGKAFDPRKAKRTITVDMSDNMRFTPSQIKVKRGDTVRFVGKNGGRLLHEMVLGTKKELAEHAEVMRKFPDMEHDEPYQLHVAPGESREMGWQFTQPGVFYYGCLHPGHFEAGMVGKIIVK